MATVTVSVEGSAAPAQVWERYADIGRWTSWAPHIRAVEPSAPRLAPGVRGVVRSVPPVSARFVVDTVQEPERRWTWTVRAYGATLHLEHRVEEVPAGTRATVVVRAPAVLAYPYRPVMAYALGRLVAANG
ncbi:SRPBCC family protein [Luteipulveratus flavus]|uniref:SRPBCC family protein n=1 Tax=Luteipulveratus flavus TaxID=3031728 RepID=A0ABT6CB74_9MICO|nr:SRPBCC family protein [Luteipulveratus sp. YIM 133296]MDF8266152.1 SRPBCC family protein [Luteipulveratus sp. YIM 133296]